MVLPNSIHKMADYPMLAAHYDLTYEAINHWGGDGITTFGTPNTEEMVYANVGGSDMFAILGDTTGTKAHTHPLSGDGYARIRSFEGSSVIGSDNVDTGSSHEYQLRFSGGGTWSSNPFDSFFATPLDGDTDADSSIQPTFVCQYVIQAV